MLQQPQNKYLLLIIGLVAVAQCGFALYLPSLPAITESLHTEPSAVQSTVFLYVLGISLSQWFYGPASDYYGRRRIALFGLALFIGGAILALLSYKLDFLLMGRALQGIGMGAVMTVSRAILRDVFKGKTYVKNASKLASVIAVSPVIFPVFGGYFQAWWGWKANFVFMLVFAVLVGLCWCFFFTESNRLRRKLDNFAISSRNESFEKRSLQDVNEDSKKINDEEIMQKGPFPKRSNVRDKKTSLNIRTVLKNYIYIIRSPIFIKNTLCGGLIYAGEVIFLTMAPFLIQQKFHLTASLYGWLMFIAIVGFIFGSQASSYLANRLRHEALILVGLGFCLLSVCFLFVVYGLNIESIFSILSPVSLFMFGAGFVYPNTSVGAVGYFPENAGTASALLSSIQGGVAMIATAIIIANQSNSLATLMIGFAIIVLPSCMLGLSIFYQENDRVLD